MRRMAVLAVALLAGSMALQGAVAAQSDETRVAVPRGNGRQEVVVLTRTFPVGGSSGWHTHPGIEIGQVVSGVTEMRSTGNPPRRYGPGERFVIPRGLAHNGVNVGIEPATLMITYVVDAGAPLRRPVPEPKP